MHPTTYGSPNHKGGGEGYLGELEILNPPMWEVRGLPPLCVCVCVLGGGGIRCMLALFVPIQAFTFKRRQ